jgi:hypothetical protein
MGSDFLNVGYCECQKTLRKKMIISHWPTTVIMFNLSLNAYCSIFVGLAFVGKEIVFRSIIEYSSLRDFSPFVISLFLYEDFFER